VGYSYDATTFAIAVGLAAIVVWCYAVYDFSKTDEADIQTFDRTVWLVLLTFGSVLGALLWLLRGRSRTP
jgi:Phospholipase_D-nuclease N-terminal